MQEEKCHQRQFSFPLLLFLSRSRGTPRLCIHRQLEGQGGREALPPLGAPPTTHKMNENPAHFNSVRFPRSPLLLPLPFFHPFCFLSQTFILSLFFSARSSSLPVFIFPVSLCITVNLLILSPSHSFFDGLLFLPSSFFFLLSPFILFSSCSSLLFRSFFALFPFFLIFSSRLPLSSSLFPLLYFFFLKLSVSDKK